FISEEYYNNLKKGKIQSGDLLLVKDGATIGKIVLVKNMPFNKTAVNEHVFILRTNALYNNQYLFYCIWCDLGQKQIYLQIRGSAQGGLTSEFINYVLLPEISLYEQQKIADFLDKKTAKIDELIDKKKRMIALLKEERMAVINQAVTRGLNPDVPMKPSGIDWLGDIPEGWKVIKLKWIYKYIKSGDNISPNEINPDNEYPVYGGNGIMGYTSGFNSDTEDLIIGRVGAKCGNIYLVNGKKWITDNALLLAINKNNKKFAYYFIKDRNLNQLANQNAQPLITGSIVGNQHIALPAFSNQQEIADFLDKKTAKIDALVAKIESAIEKLQEYRASLITSAVTGKIDVREETA
ncbi:restriction endonuclease subunit S, partial [bacterium]|nr:restriction endonuclease subunit S [bacterium]